MLDQMVPIIQMFIKPSDMVFSNGSGVNLKIDKISYEIKCFEVYISDEYFQL